MFDDALIKAEMLAIGYVRLSKFVYKASWGPDEVEHFIYFKIDSRGYFGAFYGLRNPVVEEFGIKSAIRYGHPNRVFVLQHRDPKTACSMMYEFGRVDKFSGALWPRIRVADIPSLELSQFVVGFIARHIFPIVRHVLTLKDLWAPRKIAPRHLLTNLTR
jgi:hypothetical protein